MENMYIRHAVGSLLLWDSKKHNCSYSIEQLNGAWKIIIEVTDEALAEKVMSNRQDLNIFVVDEDNPNHKTWYYSKQSIVDYDQLARTITIIADVQTEYVV
jgi:siroheme synthase (precorrin-2 oxidase/ferrochelatase)